MLQSQQGRALYLTTFHRYIYRTSCPLLPRLMKSATLPNMQIWIVSWLRSYVQDNIVALSGFNLVRKDRVYITHGGICVYIKDNINFTILEDLEDPSFEALWLKITTCSYPEGIQLYCVRNNLSSTKQQ